MKKNWKIFLILPLLLANLLFVDAVFAQSGTVIPKVESEDCMTKVNEFIKGQAANTKYSGDKTQLVACAITTGKLTLSMVPYFISYFSNYLLGIVSLISVLFVVIGGFQYAITPYTNAKDKGKTYIRNALIGMGIAFMSWSFINILLYLFTG